MDPRVIDTGVDGNGYAWFVYPSSKDIEFRENDKVFVNTHKSDLDGDAVVISEGRLTEGNWKNRFRCQFDSDSSVAHVQSSRIYPRFPAAEFAAHPSVILTPETEHFRELARTNVTSSDFVVEIGSSFGVCTARLAQRAGRVEGFDTSVEAIEHCKKEHPSLADHFHLLNILEEEDRFLEICGGADKVTAVFIDIGGDRGFDAITAALRMLFRRGLRPRLIVIKNRALFHSACNHLSRETLKTKYLARMPYVSAPKTLLLNDGEEVAVDSLPWWGELVVWQAKRWVDGWMAEATTAAESS